MKALIDSDIVCYRCAATAEDDESWIAQARTDRLVEDILQALNASEYKLFLSGPTNFRKEIYPEYKANRKQPKPKHLEACRNYLLEHWEAQVVDGYEADDALGMEQSRMENRAWSVVCSIDKDLKMIPGTHYDFVKKELSVVQPEAAMRAFYTQLLTGDSGDNIKGCPGIGKVKARLILDGCETDQQMFEACQTTYNDDEALLFNAKLIWIWRKANDIWSFQKVNYTPLESEVQSVSMH